LGAFELALIVAFSIFVGTAWAARAHMLFGGALPEGVLLGGLALGAGVAHVLVSERVHVFRGHAPRGGRALDALIPASLALTAWGWTVGPGAAAFALLPTLSALILAPVGTGILFYRAPRSGAPRLWHLLGGLWVFGYLFAIQVLLLLVVAPLSRLWIREADRRLVYLRRMSGVGARRLFDWFPYGRLDLIDVTEAAFERRAVVVSNHQSSVDIPLVLSLPGDVRLTLKQRVWDAPFLGIAARRLGHLLVEQDRPEATLERCRGALEEGASAHFFPEGTRSDDDYPKRFRRGAFDVAVELGCDVVPLVLCDTNMCVPRDAHWVEDYHMVVKALPPVTPASFDYSLGPRALMKHVQELVRAEYLVEHARIHTAEYLAYKVRRLYRYQGREAARAVERQLADEQTLTVLAEALPTEGRVVDLFCGVGVLTNWMRLKWPRLDVRAFDTDESVLRTARSSTTGTTRVVYGGGSLEEWDLGGAVAAVVGAADVSRRDEALARLRESLPAGASIVVLGEPPCTYVLGASS
jgi:1-acyl-sn-glycerol-3-phosphate acyltransferase